MEIYLNGCQYQVNEYLTFQQLFQQSGLPGLISNKNWQRNGQPLIVNQNSLIKDILKQYDEITIIDKPQKQGSNTFQPQTNLSNQGFGNMNSIQYQTLQKQQQQMVFQQNQFLSPGQFGSLQSGQIGFIQDNQQYQQPIGIQNYQQPNFNNQSAQYPNQQSINQQQPQSYDVFQTVQQQQSPDLNNQTAQYPTQNQYQQPINQSQPQYHDVFQTVQQQQYPNQNNQTTQYPLQNQYQQAINQSQPQQQFIDVFQTVQNNNNQTALDIFSTELIYSNYDQERQQYLQNKTNCPGDKQNQQIRGNYRFTLDNYGNDLIIEKLDQSFYLKINDKYQLNKVRQFDIVNKKQQFESNIILDLNFTRVSWIQNLDLLAVQFNTGKIIALQIFME